MQLHQLATKILSLASDWETLLTKPDGALSRIRTYADVTSAYSSIQPFDFFDRLEMTAGMEEDLRCIVEWGKKWLVSFNATKTKLLYFNRLRERSWIPLKMNDIG